MAKNSQTPLECFDLFVTQQMLEEIVLFTNMHIRIYKEKFSRERDTKETDLTEIKALVGLLLMAGMKKMHHLNIHEMWIDDGTAPDIFRATMSKTRFFFLLRNVRFDAVETRAERAQHDNMAAMRIFFETFVSNCQTHYQIGENGTIDEMLESFRGRCKFRVYMANKPAKYGIKIFALVDSKSFYTSNLEVYTGKQPEGPFNVDNRPSALVKRLSTNILNTGRNITMDNYFTSIPLADDLVANHRTTIVGTVRRNKKEIPPCFLNIKDRDKPSTMFGFGEKKVLISYVPNKKNKKVVLLLSTLHNDNKIDETTGAAQKPEIITYYNGTKGGVDVVDQMKEEYSA
ncbi:piggyBac transposable element-derived protein 4-like [Vanessa cardui]|uniref:piggyBac transposable element-derived protein 4-like n=1 Tax=Vanessa cardui TaxID=171605 RepID=UPI001F132562|nr:piggyBac transposable element-derived protein 4-like [Vanessa cardui]